jgi:hypothetical protein
MNIGSSIDFSCASIFVIITLNCIFQWNKIAIVFFSNTVSGMKTLELISILSAKDLKALEIELEQKSKSTTHKALQFCAQQTAIDKTDFFKCLFDKPYSVAKDYLLRNEIRLLNQAIEDFIVRQAIQKKENDWWNKKLLLQHYLSKNNTKLFDEEWQQCYKKATAEGLHFFLFELLCLRAQFVSQHLSVNESNYTELVQHIGRSIYCDG